MWNEIVPKQSMPEKIQREKQASTILDHWMGNHLDKNEAIQLKHISHDNIQVCFKCFKHDNSTAVCPMMSSKHHTSLDFKLQVSMCLKQRTFGW